MKAGDHVAHNARLIKGADKTHTVGDKSDFHGPFNTFVGFDRRFLHLIHVIIPRLSVVLSHMGVFNINGKEFAQNISNFATIASFSPNNLCLALIVVAGREKLTEDHFRNHHALLWIHLNRNSITVVFHREDRITFAIGRHGDVNVFHRGHSCGGRGADVFIPSIDDDFVKDLEESWIERGFTPDHFAVGGIIDPASFLIRFGATHIGIRNLQNVLVMGMFLVFLRACGSSRSACRNSSSRSSRVRSRHGSRGGMPFLIHTEWINFYQTEK